MRVVVNPDEACRKELCRRPSTSNPVIGERVRAIIERVRDGGDEALLGLAEEIDGYRPEYLELGEEQFLAAERRVSEEVKTAIRNAARNIELFHRAQLPGRIEVETEPGVLCVQKPVPIRKVGLYVPGGTAPLFSTVLMLAVPARLAGCSEIVLCSPASKRKSEDGSAEWRIADEVVWAARFCGVNRVFAVGGAQAVAAMAYGTESIPSVDKIFGPGNQYVTAAKQILSSDKVAVDMPAGPSEVMVLADGSSDPAFVAADLLSQAEHGRDSQVMLVCDKEEFAHKVVDEVLRQTARLGRRELAEAALAQSSAIVLENREQMVGMAELYAPEHLIIQCERPWEIAERITAAGSVFVGNYTPESAGDYASGTNHTLPTCAWARSFSGVNVDSFMRKMTLQHISREGIEGLAGTIVTMAEAEGLQAHAEAVRVRLAGGTPACVISENHSESDSSTCGCSDPEIAGIDALVRGNIRALEPYSTARDDYRKDEGNEEPQVFLDANESPFGNGWNRYPDPHQLELKRRIAAIKGCDAANIFAGNGSDECIDLLFRVFCEPGIDNAVAIEPSYGMYPVAAATNNVEYRKVSLNDDFSLSAERLLASCDSHTRLLFICSPNNPSGNAFDPEELLDISRRFPGITVIDEAYVDFSGKGSLIDCLPANPRLVVLQTLSKAWGLAGLRVGLAFAHKRIIDYMSRVKYPYNLSAASQKLALRALSEPIDGKVEAILEQRRLLGKELASLSCVLKVYPSDANFLLVKTTDGDGIYSYLIDKGIIVRNRSRVKLCGECLRITVGLPEENRRLLEALSEYEK